MTFVFVSVGTMMPFDRLCKAMDEWAAANPDVDVEIQIGKGEYEPGTARWTRLMPVDEYREKIARADVFVGHCGMGSIITAIESGKPLVMLPRRKALGEHNTDHQLATAEHFGTRRGLHVCDDTDALKAKIDALVHGPSDTPEAIAPYADPALTDAIHRFIHGGIV